MIFFFLGTLRLSESETESSTPTTSKSIKPTSSTASTPLVDGLSSDYADMTLGNSKNSMRNTGPSLSPKENIKKLKSSFFGCNKIDEHKMDCASGTIRPVATHAKPMPMTTTPTAAPNVPTNSKNANCDEGDYTLMNPILNRRNVSSATHHTQHPSSAFATTSGAATPKAATTSTATKKTAVVTIDPDKVLANAQNKTNIDGFKPITSRADKEVFQQNNKSVPTTNATTNFNRQHSVPVEKLQRKNSSNTSANDNGGYELLELRSSSSSHAMMSSGVGGGSSARIARPNSVNSEKTTFTPLMRPNSANSERQSTSTFSLTSTPLNESGTQSVRRLKKKKTGKKIFSTRKKILKINKMSFSLCFFQIT